MAAFSSAEARRALQGKEKRLRARWPGDLLRRCSQDCAQKFGMDRPFGVDAFLFGGPEVYWDTALRAVAFRSGATGWGRAFVFTAPMGSVFSVLPHLLRRVRGATD